MKRVFFLFLILLSVSPVFAKWRPLTQAELLEHADLIVVARLNRVLSEEKVGKEQTQIVMFKTERVLKGKALKSLQVYGSKTNLCIPQIWFVDQSDLLYLLFLKAGTENRFGVLNGHFGALPVKENQVDWFNQSESNPWKRSPQPLTHVEQSILNELGSKNNNLSTD